MEISPDLSLCTLFDSSASFLDFLESLPLSCDQIHSETLVVHQYEHLSQVDSIRFRYPDTDFLESPGPVGRAINHAFAASTARYTAIVHKNVSPQPGSFRKIIDFMDDHPDAGIGGPSFFHMDGSRVPSAYSFPSFFALLLLAAASLIRNNQDITPAVSHSNARLFSSVMEADWVPDLCMVIRRETFEQTGFLDNRLSGLFLPMEFCFRAKKTGWHVHFIPGSRMILKQHPCFRPSLTDILRYIMKTRSY